MEQGFGVQADAVLLFNILHCEQPVQLLQHARNALRECGKVLIIHWRHDVATPRSDGRHSPQSGADQRLGKRSCSRDRGSD